MDNKTENQQEKFERRPSRRINLRTSKDGKFFMVDVVETWFFPVRYVATIAANAGIPKPAEEPKKTNRVSKKVGA